MSGYVRLCESLDSRAAVWRSKLKDCTDLGAYLIMAGQAYKELTPLVNEAVKMARVLVAGGNQI